MMPLKSTPNDFDDELLSAYVDGELTAAECALVEERLRTDPAAAALVEELRGLSAAVKSLPREALGRDLRAAILAEASETRADLEAHAPARADQFEPLPPHNHWPGIRRGLVWSTFAIAATLLVSLFQPAERDRDPVTLAKAEREVKSAAPANRFEEHSGAAQEKLTDGEGEANDRLAADDRLPPGLRGGMSAAPASASAETAIASADQTLSESAGESIASSAAMEPTEEPAVSLGALDSAAPPAGAPSSSLTSAPPSIASRAGGVGGVAAPAAGAMIASPMTVTLRTTGPGGAQRLEQLLAESRLALDEPADKTIEKPASQLAGDALAQGQQQAAARITDGVIIEATPQQIDELLAKCRGDQQTFAAVEIHAPSAQDRSKFYAQGAGAFGGGGEAVPSLINRNGKQLPWARESNAVAESPAEPAEDLERLAMRKLAAPVDAVAPLAAQPEEAATRSSLMTTPPTEPAAASSAPPAGDKHAKEQRSIAEPAQRIRVLFLLESADAPKAVPPADVPIKAAE